LFCRLFFQLYLIRPNYQAIDVYKILVRERQTHPIPSETPKEMQKVIKGSFDFDARARYLFENLFFFVNLFIYFFISLCFFVCVFLRPTFIQMYEILLAINSSSISQTQRYPLGTANGPVA
jgi:hypothetical protein